MKKGWETKRLPEIAQYSIGLTYSPKDVSDEGTVVLRSANIQNDELDLSDLVRVAGPVKQTLRVRVGDILMCSRNGSKRLVGKTAVIGKLPEEMTFGTFMTVIRGTSNPYLAWFFKSDAFRKQIGVGENTMINQVTKYMLDAIRVPFPPPAERQRIVGLLDEAFAGLATAQANAEKNQHNARALFESHLQSVFAEHGHGWVKKRLGDLSRICYGYTQSASAEQVGPHFLRITDIQDNLVNWITVPYCSIDAADLPKYKLADGDIVFARTGATTGKSYLVTKPPHAVFASYLIRVQLKEKEVLPQFVNLFFQTHSYRNTIRAGVSGSAQGGFNATKLRELLVPFPQSLDEQRAIAAKLDVVAEETRRLAHLYERKLAALVALKRSLLHQAFTGNL